MSDLSISNCLSWLLSHRVVPVECTIDVRSFVGTEQAKNLHLDIVISFGLLFDILCLYPLCYVVNLYLSELAASCSVQASDLTFDSRTANP